MKIIINQTLPVRKIRRLIIEIIFLRQRHIAYHP